MSFHIKDHRSNHTRHIRSVDIRLLSENITRVLDHYPQFQVRLSQESILTFIIDIDSTGKILAEF
jgi:hypothetical protein